MSREFCGTTPAALPRVKHVAVPSSFRPTIFVVVDTEEEFEWSAPFARTNTAVTAMSSIDRAQSIFDRYGVRPTYVVDYPVVDQDEGVAPLLEIWRTERCAIGAHLHPWVTPPYEEPISRRNSFTCNLPIDLQEAKLRTLTARIAERFDAPPDVFKAGRYGLGPATVRLLDELNYRVDASVCPKMDFTAEEGPSFAAFDSKPFFLTPSLLEVPCTVDYVGWAGSLGPSLRRAASGPVGSRFRAVGVLARAGVVNQIMLSPEGNTYEEMRSLTRVLVHRGCPVMTLSFHSPSVAVGHTPYVRTDAQLRNFLDTIDRYLDFFMNDLGGKPGTLREFRESAMEFTSPL